MRVSGSALGLVLLLSFPPCGRSESITEASKTSGPFVAPRTLVDGVIKSGDATGLPAADVYSCCVDAVTVGQDDQDDEDDTVCRDDDHRGLAPTRIGAMPQFDQEDSLRVLDVAKRAWDGGAGAWPQASLKERVAAVETFVTELQKDRERIVTVLMWEIGKNRQDAESEFDRTMVFVAQAIASIRAPANADFDAGFRQVGTSATRAFRRRAAVGILICLGPMNYPLNETYATLIPALLMGNVVIMKIPTIGGLAHLLTMEAFAKALPPGAINLISGGGRVTMPPLMATGDIDGLAFIGGSAAADDLIRQHPEPHRLKLFLQLEAKNMGIVLADIFQPGNEDSVENAAKEIITGSLSFNGQRCTAIKLIFVPSSDAAAFAQKVAAKVDALRVGLPWQRWDDADDEDTDALYSQITPLPNQKRVQYMQRLVADATAKGARVLNKNGGQVIGGPDSTLLIPAVLFPVDPSMDIYHEEQFGPVVPIAPYDDLDATVLRYGQDGKYGQQVAVFTSRGGDDAVRIVDRFSSVFGKININSQCGRSPDTLPFSGRRSSAMGVMSIDDSLREFSIPTVVAYKGEGNVSERVAQEIRGQAKFMESVL